MSRTFQKDRPRPACQAGPIGGDGAEPSPSGPMVSTDTVSAAGTTDSIGSGEPDCAPTGEDKIKASADRMVAETSRTADTPFCCRASLEAEGSTGAVGAPGATGRPRGAMPVEGASVAKA